MLLVATLERWLAACWMVYKFMGYETSAFITLGRQAAMPVILVALTGGGISFVRWQRLPSTNEAAKWWKWAFAMFSLSMALFLLLAFGPLNKWRN